MPRKRPLGCFGGLTACDGVRHRNRRLTIPRQTGGAWRLRGARAMTKTQLAAEIRKVVKMQLDDCERAIKAGTRSIALFELEDAAKRLQKIAALLEK